MAQDDRVRPSEHRATESRKAEHVQLAATGEVGHRRKLTGFADVEFEHNALPELAMSEIDTSSSVLSHPLSAPIVISSMTGGYPYALAINRALAELAERYGLAIGAGSQRQALESDVHHDTYRVLRQSAPRAFVFANLGGVELAKLHAAGDASALERVIDLLEANAIAVHLNPLQELMQPEGSRDFRGVLNAIAWAVRTLRIPVIAKEVGAGISATVAEKLLDVGVRAIDVAGAGGTSWAGIEILRSDNNVGDDASDRDRFWDWGIPTVECLRQVSPLKNERPFELIASGGVASGLDAAKSIALGADAAGFARPLIRAFVAGGESALDRAMSRILHELRIAMILTGSRTLGELRSARLLHT
jgi:isopentenyl-diphosphate delta-isomerase